jgi:DNA-binding Lrp family transcriptional regulator
MVMKRGRRPLKSLNSRDREIIDRLNTTLVTMPQIAQEYGITKQRVYEIMVKAKSLGYNVNRPKLVARKHSVKRCGVCRKICSIARKDDLMTRRQLAQVLKIDVWACHWHLNRLKEAGAVSREFATIRSDNLVKALRFYKKTSLSTNAVGRKFGYKNFYSLLNYQKQKGLNVAREEKFGSETA